MNRQQVRIDTDDFLNRAQGSVSFEPVSAGLIPAEGLSDALMSALSRENIFLTGAAQAILPMTIAVPGNDGLRAQITLLINPENMNHGKTNAAQTVYTRNGWIPQLWGDNQDMLTATGKSAMFMVSGEGAAELLKKYSFGFLNFMALVSAYKNNGYRMNDQTDPQAATRVIDLVQGVELSYDGQIFMGHFNNFTIDETAESPFIFSYNFEFVCSSLSTNYNYIRGHFRPLDDIQTTSQSNFDNSDRSLGEDDPTSTLIYDVGANGPVAHPTTTRQKTDETCVQLWEKATLMVFPPYGLPWSEAVERKYTNGSYNQNMKLRGQLLTAFEQGTLSEFFTR